MRWGVFQAEGEAVQIVPCSDDGLCDPNHLLYIECVCGPTVEQGGALIIHEDIL